MCYSYEILIEVCGCDENEKVQEIYFFERHF